MFRKVRTVQGQDPLPAFSSVHNFLSGHRAENSGARQDIFGPSFKPDEYLEFNADITANPWWTLTGGVEGAMSLDATFLGETLASYYLSIPK